MANIMGQFKIGTRVYAGFFIILAMLGWVALIGHNALTKADEGFDAYADTSDNTVRNVGIDRNMVGLRRNVILYTENSDEKALARVKELRREIEEDIQKSIKATPSDDRRRMLTTLESQVRGYLMNFDKAAQLRVELGLSPESGLQGALRKAVHAIEGEINALKNDALMVEMLQMRRDEKDFLLRGDKKYIDKIEGSVSGFKKALAASGASDEIRSRIEKLQVEYMQNFKDMATSTLALKLLIAETMAPLAADAAKTLGELVAIQKKDMTENFQQTNEAIASSETFVIIASSSSVIIGVFFAWVIAGGITGPVRAMTDAMTRLAGGDKMVVIPAQNNTDEIGDMAKAAQVFKENALKIERMMADFEAVEAKSKIDKKKMLNDLADGFDASVKGIVNAVASAATEMQSTAASMSSISEETSRQATSVAAASEEASTNVQTVSAAAEELSTSISEISRQVTQAAKISRNAMNQAQHTNEMVQGLAVAADRIGEVVKLINDIASQTNLLALNATIEAARAGDAGKGFAVVANEVKSLANQTAKATEEIGQQISAVQNATKEAVEAIKVITGTIAEVSEISNSIASAVEEQGAATKEIARNVDQAAEGTQDVSRNISGVTSAADEAGQSASQVLDAAGELSQQAETLRKEVDNFIARIRVA